MSRPFVYRATCKSEWPPVHPVVPVPLVRRIMPRRSLSMSKTELIRSLFDYNEWANNAILDAASGVSEGEITRDLGPGGAGHGNLQGILLHILGSHVSWLMKWTGEPPHIARVEPGRVMPAIRESFDVAHERLRAYVGSLTDEALDAETELMDPAAGRPLRTSRPPP